MNVGVTTRVMRPRPCPKCGYDLRGLFVPRQEFVRCPECGLLHDLARIPWDLVREPLPPAWEIAWSLGRPMMVWAVVMAVVWHAVGVVPVSLAILGVFIVVVAIVRATALSAECAKPEVRSWTTAYVVSVALVASAGSLPAAVWTVGVVAWVLKRAAGW